MNKREMLAVWFKDPEFTPQLDSASSSDLNKKYVKPKLYIKDVKKAAIRCPKCGGRQVYKLDTDEQPEWTYICAKCKIMFIAVWEDANVT